MSSVGSPEGDGPRQIAGAAFFVGAIAAGIAFLMFAPATIVSAVKDWQTLLAGLLAAVAAFFTVLQMQITDAKAANRHNQLFAAELRDDRLALRHARFQLDLAKSHITRLETLADDLGVYVGSYVLNRREEPTEVTDVVMRNTLETWKKMADAYREAFYVLDGERVREASKLFGPRLSEKHEELLRRTRQQPSRWKFDLESGVDGYTHQDFPALRNAHADAVKSVADDISKNVGLTAREWRELLEGVDRLIRRYPVVLDAE